MAQKLKTLIIILTSLLSLSFLALPAAALAASAPCGDTCSTNGGATSTTSVNAQLGNGCINADGTKLSQRDCLAKNPIVKDLNLFVTVLSAGVGIVVVAMIILGGIQYSLAGGSPDKVKEARKRILNALLAMVAFVLTFTFLQWLIPGGIFS